MKYDYFLAGRWRNHAAIREVMRKIRETGKTVYCFVENSYEGDALRIDAVNGDPEEYMSATEKLATWQTDPTFREIFEKDMRGLRDSESLVFVFPAGWSAHMELGAAYGMGKTCYGIGTPEKAETLYLMFDEIFPDAESFLEAKVGVAV
ncbi:MAG: hypothetical protein WA843_02810 [Candidatus Saccharimonadales bacterium]